MQKKQNWDLGVDFIIERRSSKFVNTKYFIILV